MSKISVKGGFGEVLAEADFYDLPRQGDAIAKVLYDRAAENIRRWPNDLAHYYSAKYRHCYCNHAAPCQYHSAQLGSMGGLTSGLFGSAWQKILGW